MNPDRPIPNGDPTPTPASTTPPVERIVLSTADALRCVIGLDALARQRVLTAEEHQLRTFLAYRVALARGERVGVGGATSTGELTADDIARLENASGFSSAEQERETRLHADGHEG